jgi:hypothetical protein
MTVEVSALSERGPRVTRSSAGTLDRSQRPNPRFHCNLMWRTTWRLLSPPRGSVGGQRSAIRGMACPTPAPPSIGIGWKDPPLIGHVPSLGARSRAQPVGPRLDHRQLGLPMAPGSKLCS